MLLLLLAVIQEGCLLILKVPYSVYLLHSILSQSNKPTDKAYIDDNYMMIFFIAP